MWRRIKALIIKEFLSIWQDKRSRMAVIAPPLIQFFIFTFAATLDVKNITLGLLNRDSGHYSYELVEKFKGSPFFKRILYLESTQDIANAIDYGKTLTVVHIDETFSRKILSGQPAQVQVITDGRKSNSAQIVQGYIASIIDRFNQDFVLPKDALPAKSKLVQRYWYNPNLYYPWFTIAGLTGVISMLTSVSVTALSIAREKESGTFEQLLVCPMSRYEILIGKALPAIIIGVTEGTLMLFAGILFIDLPIQGSLFYFYPCMLVFIFSIVGIGLFVSSISKTQQQATLGVFLFMSPAIIMSGFATPVENMPVWLQYVAAADPLKYFIIIARGICLKDITFNTVFNNTWPMLLIALVTLNMASWFFRKQTG